VFLSLFEPTLEILAEKCKSDSKWRKLNIQWCWPRIHVLGKPCLGQLDRISHLMAVNCKHFKTATQSAAGKAKHIFYFMETPCDSRSVEGGGSDALRCVTLVVLCLLNSQQWVTSTGRFILVDFGFVKLVFWKTQDQEVLLRFGHSYTPEIWLA
jgi:hypothetical protein